MRSEIEERLARARHVLTGVDGTDGLQAWWADEIEQRTGWRPAKSTVHRYMIADRDPDPRALSVLEALEEEAQDAPGVPEPADLPALGFKAERNILLLADWINGMAPADCADKYGVTAQRVHALIQRAGVRRLAETF